MASLKSLTINDNGFFKLPTGTDAQRPGTPTEGGIRYNTTHGGKEIYRGNRWKSKSPKGITRSLLSRTADSGSLELHLDAEDTDSYPGSGTVWYDLSGNDIDFNIVAGAWRKSYMDFRGNYGCAKRAADFTLSGSVTYVMITRPLDSIGNWRTLARPYANDHYGIIQSGAWNVGMYDNNGAGFIDAGFDQNLTPGYDDKRFELWIMRWQNSATTTLDYHINGQYMGAISNTNAYHTAGPGCIGAYHGGSTSPSASSSQFWGDIRLFQAYSYRFTDEQIWDTYLALKGRLG